VTLADPLDARINETFLEYAQARGFVVDPARVRHARDNAYAERFVRSVKTECTERMVFFSRSSLERALTHYLAHYHEERNHQGLQNSLLKCSDGPINSGGRVQRRERLGGMLNFYHREAA
jgi:transposase InsO family protein